MNEMPIIQEESRDGQVAAPSSTQVDAQVDRRIQMAERRRSVPWSENGPHETGMPHSSSRTDVNANNKMAEDYGVNDIPMPRSGRTSRTQSPSGARRNRTRSPNGASRSRTRSPSAARRSGVHTPRDGPHDTGMPGSSSRTDVNANNRVAEDYGVNDIPIPRSGRASGTHTPSRKSGTQTPAGGHKSHPSMVDRIIGKLEILEGKLMNNEERVTHGKALKNGVDEA